MLSSLFYISFPVLFAMTFILTDSLNKNTIGAYSYFLAFFPLLYLLGYSKALKRTQIFLISSIFSISKIRRHAIDKRKTPIGISCDGKNFPKWPIWEGFPPLTIHYDLPYVSRDIRMAPLC